MYWTPWARLMKSITPNTSVSPAAIRNRSTPSWRPFSVCTRRRVKLMASLHPSSERGGWLRVSGANEETGGDLPSISNPTRPPLRGVHPPPAGEGQARASLHPAILDVRIGVVGEHFLHDLGLVLAVGALGDLHQIEVLNRVVVGVVLELAAQRLEVSLHQGGAQRVLVVGFAAGRLESAVD